MLKFITSNKGKVEEVQGILGKDKIEQLDIELAEIQSMDPREIIEHKLKEASQHHDGAYIVEDVAVGLEALNGFPGPLVKWFVQALNYDEVYNLVTKLQNSKAEHKVIYGYYSPEQEIRYFEGVTRGEIVPPRGNGFGWDPMFKPEGSDKTYGEMNLEEKLQYTPRTPALQQLKAIL